MLKKIAFCLVAVLTIATFSGCQTMKDLQYKPQYVLKFVKHIKYPGRSKAIEKQITDPRTNETYWINANQFFDSSSIEEVRMVPIQGKDGMYNLAFRLDSTGSNRWSSLCGSTSGSNHMIIITIDGEFYTIYSQKLQLLEDDEVWVMCNAEFDMLMAKNIENSAKNNYRFYNPSTGDWLFNSK